MEDAEEGVVMEVEEEVVDGEFVDVKLLYCICPRSFNYLPYLIAQKLIVKFTLFDLVS